MAAKAEIPEMAVEPAPAEAPYAKNIEQESTIVESAYNHPNINSSGESNIHKRDESISLQRLWRRFCALKYHIPYVPPRLEDVGPGMNARGHGMGILDTKRYDNHPLGEWTLWEQIVVLLIYLQVP
jgi:hypothetical protein